MPISSLSKPVLAENDDEFDELLRSSPFGIGSDIFLAKIKKEHEKRVESYSKKENVSFRKIGKRVEPNNILNIVAKSLEIQKEDLFMRQRNSWSRAIALKSIRFSILAEAYYEQQRAKGKKHHTAVRSLAFKWIRIIYRCCQTRTAYDENSYIRALQKRNSGLLHYIAQPYSDDNLREAPC